MLSLYNMLIIILLLCIMQMIRKAMPLGNAIGRAGEKGQGKGWLEMLKFY